MAEKYVMVIVKAENINHAKGILGSSNFDKNWVQITDLNNIVELEKLTDLQNDIVRFTPAGKEYQKQQRIKNDVAELVSDYDLDSDVEQEILEIIERATK